MHDRADRHIVLLGGGFAGTALARRLRKGLPAGWAVTVVDDGQRADGNGHRVVTGRVEAVDTAARRVRCETSAGPIELPYDHLVCAFGARAVDDPLPGLAAHALPLRAPGDVPSVRDAVLRRRPERVVVLGGGFAGVAIAGELVDAGGPHVSLVADDARLLPELPEPLGAAALASLRGRGADVRLSAAAAEVTGERVTLKDGAVLEAACVVWAPGLRPNALVRQLDVMTDKGRIVTAGNLRVPGLDGVWALGDCAVVPNAEDGGVSAPTAPFAAAQAAALAFNLRATILGETTRAFSCRPRAAAAVGRRAGVAEVAGRVVGGRPAWWLWRAWAPHPETSRRDR